MGFGTGHNVVAETLKDNFLKPSGVKAEAVDLLKLIPNTFHPFLQSGYNNMLNRFPFFYHYLYDWTNNSRVFRYVSSEFIEKMGWVIRKKLNILLNDIRPTRIVVTHPFCLLVLPSKWAKVPTVGVVTDYEIHPIWLERIPSVMCVPKCPLVKTQLNRIQWKTGLRIYETGVPISSEFYSEMGLFEARSRLGLDKQPLVLIMGGGMGLGPLEYLVNELRSLKQFRFVVLTGSNENLFERLKDQKFDPHIRIEPFRNDIPVWMSAADLLVTKPGGVTISEAIAKRLPMFLFKSFPGQEEANQRYLIQNRVAVLTSPSTIKIQIEKFFSSDELRYHIRNQFIPLSVPNASRQIVDITIKTETHQVLNL